MPNVVKNALAGNIVNIQVHILYVFGALPGVQLYENEQSYNYSVQAYNTAFQFAS